MMRGLCSFSMFIGRLCLGALFLISGIFKFITYDASIQYMAAKGFTMVPFFLIAAACVEIVFALALIIGYKVRLSALILILYLIPVTIIFHDFWNLLGADRAMQMIHFLKNIGIFGGLFYILGAGSGKWGCDACGCGTSSCDISCPCSCHKGHDKGTKTLE
jgi:putative oxidoreductase